MTRLPVGVFFALFTASGFAGLIYESIWSHYLKLFLGHAAYAQTLVLAIFMGGMALGSWLVSRVTQRLTNLLLGYALAELGIGLMALVFNGVFRASTGWAFETVLPALGGTGMVDAFKWGLASLLILPASVLLGATFPLMSAGILRVYPETGGRALSMLYFTNSLGAAIGVLASGFILIDRVGLPGTILTAGILNVALAIVMWTLSRRLSVPAQTVAATASVAQASGIARTLLVLAFVTGAASFIYEMTWIRMLSMGLGASTHSFEVMLAAFIFGMALGALWLRNRIREVGSDIGWLAGVLLAKAAFAVYAIWAYAEILEGVSWVMAATSRTDGGYILTTIAGLIASMVVMLPTAFCAGMTLPLATQALTTRGAGEAAIGRIYSANTAGCIVGVAFATHVGMELLGLKGLTGLGAALDAGVAVLLLAVGAPPAWRARALAATAIVFVASSAAFVAAPFDLLRMSSGVFRFGHFSDPATSKVVYHRDGKTATIAVVDVGTVRTIRTNGKADASFEQDGRLVATLDEHTMMLAGVLPLAMKPNAALVANIGFGSGITTHTLLGSPNLKELDTIEIERQVVEGARFFSARNQRALTDPRSHIHIEDAKTYFATHGRRYDVIVSEPSNPWVSGVSTLFSEEFYGQVRRALKDDGLFLQWIQAYDMNVGLLSTITQPLGKAFSDYGIYYSGYGDIFVVATPTGKLPKLTSTVFDMPLVAAELRTLGYEELHDLETLRVGGKASLAPLFARTGFPSNSDYFPILDQRSAIARFRSDSADELASVRDRPIPFLALVDQEVRTPLSRLRPTGVNRPARIVRAQMAAEAIGIALSGAAEYARMITPADRTQATLVQSLLDNCVAKQDLWLDAVTRVADISMPYLDRPAVQPLFDYVTRSKCYKSLDATGKSRIAFLQAINDRNAEAMRAHAEALLAHMRPEFEDERAAYLQAAMAGALAAGRLTEARAQHDRHILSLKPREQDEFTMRLIRAHLDQARSAR